MDIYGVIERKLRSDINNALRTNVAEVVKNVESKSVYSNVYPRYASDERYPEPKIYNRRKSSGGLADKRNMVVEQEDMVIDVINKTEFNYEYGTAQYGDELAYLVEYGDGAYKNYCYIYDRAKNSHGDFHPSRPFIKPTIEYLKKTNVLVESLADSMKNYGYDVTITK